MLVLRALGAPPDRLLLSQREQQALELSDAVLQGLVVAKMALELDQPVKANEALTASIGSASRITELLGALERNPR